jgi:hypothetical protein
MDRLHDEKSTHRRQSDPVQIGNSIFRVDAANAVYAMPTNSSLRNTLGKGERSREKGRSRKQDSKEMEQGKVAHG